MLGTGGGGLMENENLDGYGTPATSWPGSGYAATPGSQWTPQRIESKRVNIIELILQQIVLALRGFLMNGSGFSQLNAWGEQFRTDILNLQEQLGQFPIIGDLLEIITGVEDGDLNDLGTYFNNLNSFFGSLNFLDPDFDVGEAITTFLSLLMPDVYEAITGIEDGDVDDLGTYFLNFRQLFEGIDFTDPDFDAEAALSDLADLLLLLPGKLLDVTGVSDLIDAAQESMRSALTGIVEATPSDLDNWLLDLVTGDSLEDALEGGVEGLQQWVRDTLTGFVNATSTDLDNWLLALLTGDSDLYAGNIVNLEDIGEIAQEKITGLVEALGDVPVLGDLAEALTGIEDGDLNDIGTWVTDLVTDGSLQDALDDGIDGVQQWVIDQLTGFVDATPTQFDDWLLGLLNVDSWLNADKVTEGTMSQDRVAELPGDLDTIDGKADAAQTKADAAEAALAARIRSGQNLVLDGGFENAAIWEHNGGNIGFAQSDEQYRGGSYSWKFVANGGTLTAPLNTDNTDTTDPAAQAWPTSAGRTYYLEVWCYCPSSNIANAGALEIWSRFHSSSGTAHPAPRPGVPCDAMVTDAWQKISGYVTCPDGYESWHPYVRLSNSVPVGDVIYIDDAHVVEVTDAYNAQQKANTTETAVNQVGDVLVGATVTPIVSAVASVQSFFQNLLGWQQNTNATQVAAISNTAQRNPVWVSRHPVADVSYPESMNLQMSLLGSTDAASAGTAHTHPLGGGGGQVQTAMWSVPQGVSRGSFVTVSSTVLHTHIGMILRRSSGAAVNNVFLEVYREAADGGLVQLYSENISSQLTTSAQLIEVELDEPIVAQAGERYLVRCWNDSSVATQVWAQSIIATAAMERTGWWTSGSNTEHESYSSGDAATHREVTDLVPFAELASPEASAADAVYSDDFNDRTELGNLYLKKQTTDLTMTVVLGKASYNPLSGNGAQNGLYIYPTSSERMYVEGRISTATLVDSTAGIFLSANRDLSQSVLLAVNGVGARLYSSTSWNSFSEEDDVGAFSAGPGTYALMYDPSSNTYIALKNGDEIMSWTDSGNTMNHDSDHRYGGIRISKTLLIPGGEVDNFVLKDYVPAA